MRRAWVGFEALTRPWPGSGCLRRRPPSAQPCQRRRWRGQRVRRGLAPHPSPRGSTCRASGRPSRRRIQNLSCTMLQQPPSPTCTCLRALPAAPPALPACQPRQSPAPELAHNVLEAGAVQLVLGPAAPHQLGVGVQPCGQQHSARTVWQTVTSCQGCTPTAATGGSLATQPALMPHLQSWRCRGLAGARAPGSQGGRRPSPARQSAAATWPAI